MRKIKPSVRMKIAPIVPSIGAAQVVVLKNVVGMMFWICGVPGSESIVKVKAPSAIVAGISRLRDVASAKKLGGERIDREHDDEQRNSAIGQKRRDENDRQHGTVSAENCHGAGNYGAHKSGKLNELAEDRTKQKDGKV